MNTQSILDLMILHKTVDCPQQNTHGTRTPHTHTCMYRTAHKGKAFMYYWVQIPGYDLPFEVLGPLGPQKSLD